ncbi:hypothetical protein [Pseudomonas aegrilactucae]|uniref:UDP-glycosyltransferase n=1 Tax=Pseudomonas aegrilactucae TaxID=2854028 RepID=A0A9Q2XGD5_9PSED|nr:hypothetical protein [Pseudomonas aegrilactucae]MBV6285864.1 hypothetical protein [Pseudomonas aegrilactucae]
MPVVLVAYGGGHVAMLAPVARSLLARGHAVVFLGLTTAGAYLERAGVPCIGYRHLPEADTADVVEWGRRLTSELAPGGAVPLQESIAYMGLNYRELVAEHGNEGAAQLFAQKGRQAFCPVGMFKRWFAMLRPSLVMATNSPRSEQAALQAAAELGVASICAVDVFALQEIQWIKKPGYASRICVLNEQVRDMFVAQGCDAAGVVVTGNPAFERLQHPEVREAGHALRTARGWGADEVVILWASQVEPERHPFAARQGDPSFPRRVEARLREFVCDHPQYRLVLRYHPSERVEFQPGQARVELSPSSEDLATLLHAVDIVVVATSTVGLEAHLAGRAVLAVQGSMFSPDAPYGQMGIATDVASPELLGQALSSINLQATPGIDELPERTGQLSPTQKLVEVVESLLGASVGGQLPS